MIAIARPLKLPEPPEPKTAYLKIAAGSPGTTPDGRAFISVFSYYGEKHSGVFDESVIKTGRLEVKIITDYGNFLDIIPAKGQFKGLKEYTVLEVSPKDISYE